MDFHYADYFGTEPSTGYERLLYDCMIGDATLFQRADMVEAGWSVVEPVLDVWKALPPRELSQLRCGHVGTEGGRRSDEARRPVLENGLSRFGTTLARFLEDERARHPGLDPGIGPLLAQMAYASKIIAREVSRAALVGRLGLVGERNATGDSQKKLDVFGSETVLDAFSATGSST